MPAPPHWNKILNLDPTKRLTAAQARKTSQWIPPDGRPGSDDITTLMINPNAFTVPEAMPHQDKNLVVLHAGGSVRRCFG